MNRTLARNGLVALVGLAVLVAWKQPPAAVRCTVSHALMPTSCCAVITDVARATAERSKADCCCEAIEPVLPAGALPAFAVSPSADGNHGRPLPRLARLAHRETIDSSAEVRLVAARYREIAAQERRPSYVRYCSYLL